MSIWHIKQTAHEQTNGRLADEHISCLTSWQWQVRWHRWLEERFVICASFSLVNLNALMTLSPFTPQESQSEVNQFLWSGKLSVSSFSLIYLISAAEGRLHGTETDTSPVKWTQLRQTHNSSNMVNVGQRKERDGVWAQESSSTWHHLRHLPANFSMSSLVAFGHAHFCRICLHPGRNICMFGHVSLPIVSPLRVHPGGIVCNWVIVPLLPC